MHIELNQSLQKVAANTTRKFLSEELDWVINKMQHRFIQLKLNPKAKDKGEFKVVYDQLNVDAIRNLVVSNKLVQSYVVSSNLVKASLPCDYMYLLADSSYVQKACDVLLSTTSATISYKTLRATRSALGASPYYVTASMTINSDTVSIPSGLPYSNSYVGFNSTSDIAELVDFYLSAFRALGYEIYWERFDTAYKPSCFIVVGNITTLTWMTDGTTSSITTDGTITTSYYAANAVDKLVANRLESSEFIPNLLSTSFYTTHYKTPISELTATYLYVYRNTSFTISNVSLNYVRKPKRVSLSLGVDCEIAEEFHQTVCDMCTEYIKGRMENQQGNQLVIGDNENRVIL